MKILILTSRVEVSSGWGRYTLDLATALRQEGHTILVACSQDNGDVGDFRQVPVLPAPMQFKKTHLFPFVYAQRLKRILKREAFRPDIIHCVVESYAPIALAASRPYHAPVVITCHGSFAVNMFGYRFIGPVQKRALVRAAAIVCVSRYTKDRLMAHVPTLSPKIIHNGIDLAHFSDIESMRREESLILGVGALKERKGFDRVIAALPQVLQRIPAARYVIIGDQHDKQYFAYLEGLAAQHGLEGRIEFLENVTEETLRSYYKRAKVFILTPVSSPTSFEGFGLVYIEAAAYGLPAIGSHDNGGEEAVIDGETGFLANSGDTDDIAKKIEDVCLMSPAAYETMSAKACERATSLSWNKVIRDYDDVYAGAISAYHK